MSRQEKIDEVLRKVLLDSRRAHNYRNASLYPANRLYVYILITQESGQEKLDSYTEACTSALCGVIQTHLRDGTTQLIYAPCDAPEGYLAYSFKQCLDEAGDLHAVDQLISITVCPIILGGMIYDGSVENTILREWLYLQEIGRRMGLQLQWQPFAMLENDDVGRLSRNECVSMVQRCIRGLREDGWKYSIQPTKRLCVLTERNESGQILSMEARMNTLLLTSVLPNLVDNSVRSLEYQDNNDEDIISAGTVTITTPIYSLLLQMLSNTLAEFYQDEKVNKDIVSQNLGNSLSGFPEHIFWRETLEKMPRMNGVILTEPIWSVLLGRKNRDEDKARLDRFMDEYYFAHLPIDQNVSDMKGLAEKFLEKYFLAGGSVLSMRSLLKGNYLRTIQDTARNDQLRVQTSAHTDRDNELVYGAEQFLANKLRNRPNEMMDICLKGTGHFIADLLDKADRTEQFIDLISQETEAFRRRWVDDEVVLQNAAVRQADRRMQDAIQKTFIQTIHDDDDTCFEAMLPYIEEIAGIVENGIPDRSSYMQDQDVFFARATQADLARVRESLDRKMQFPLQLSVVPQSSFYLLGKSQSNLTDTLQASYNAEVIGMNGMERMEIMRLAQPFSVSRVIGI